MIENILTQLFESSGVKYRTNAKSFVLDCPLCDKVNGLYLWRSTGVGKCHKCNEVFTPQKALVDLTGCTFSEARRALNTGQRIRRDSGESLLATLESFSTPQPKEEEVKIFRLPFNFYKLDPNNQITLPGIQYLTKRGISLQTANQYNLMYCPSMKRVVFPVFNEEGECLGWQARDVTGEAEFPYDSPAGFNKSRVLLGLREVTGDHLIITEGPFDFLKVAPLKGALCTFGKQISEYQIQAIKSLPQEIIYLALDPDAFELFDKYVKKLYPKKVFLMQPPENKEDFGDCSIMEVVDSFRSSRIYSRNSVLPVNILKGTR